MNLAQHTHFTGEKTETQKRGYSKKWKVHMQSLPSPTLNEDMMSACPPTHGTWLPGTPARLPWGDVWFDFPQHLFLWENTSLIFLDLSVKVLFIMGGHLTWVGHQSQGLVRSGHVIQAELIKVFSWDFYVDGSKEACFLDCKEEAIYSRRKLGYSWRKKTLDRQTLDKWW